MTATTNDEIREEAKRVYRAVCLADKRPVDEMGMPLCAAVIQRALVEAHNKGLQRAREHLRERSAASKFRIALEHAADALVSLVL